MKRRDFLKASASGLLGGFLSRLGLAQVKLKPDFYFAQVVYGTGLKWNPRPTVARSLANILNQRTSLPSSPERVEVSLKGDKIFSYPFLYLSGEEGLEPFSEEEIYLVRRWFSAGGFMLVDDALGEKESGFDRSFQRELARIFPGEKLKQLPNDHTIFQSYYLLDQVAGRKLSVPYLSGIDRDDLTILVYSQNDLAGAIEQNPGGGFRYPVEPGAEAQRERAVRLWVNIIYYALCGTYKKDAIHIPFISERRKRRPR